MHAPKLSIIFLLFVISTTSILSCKKTKSHPIPTIPFDITINISLPTYSDLMGVGGYAYVDGGSKGIVVYRSSLHEFVAFDRHSPVNDASCEKPLETDPNNFLQLRDMCSGATFSLLDGSPLSGSSVGLRRYIVEYDGNTYLRIYN